MDKIRRYEYHKEYRSKRREYFTNRNLVYKFGITLQEYSELFQAQNGVCAICEQPETATRGDKVKALAVDHDHLTGAVRGLLCTECNLGLGRMKDNRSIFLSAVRYLDKHSEDNEMVFPIKELGEAA